MNGFLIGLTLISYIVGAFGVFHLWDMETSDPPTPKQARELKIAAAVGFGGVVLSVICLSVFCLTIIRS